MNEPTTPKEINKNVSKLLKKLPEPGEPVFIDIQDEPYSILGDCYINVEKKVKNDGGNIQYGWIIWEAPNFLIESEFHAVWKSPEGEYIDITPQGGGEDKILFVPDYKKKYENDYIDNIRIPFTAEARKLCKIKEAETKRKQLYNDGTGQAKIPIELELGLTYRRAEPKIGRNSKCLCESGKKYKNCCGQ